MVHSSELYQGNKQVDIAGSLSFMSLCRKNFVCLLLCDTWVTEKRVHILHSGEKGNDKQVIISVHGLHYNKG
jgi:hypothetical protein